MFYIPRLTNHPELSYDPLDIARLIPAHTMIDLVQIQREELDAEDLLEIYHHTLPEITKYLRKHRKVPIDSVQEKIAELTIFYYFIQNFRTDRFTMRQNLTEWVKFIKSTNKLTARGAYDVVLNCCAVLPGDDSLLNRTLGVFIEVELPAES